MIAAGGSGSNEAQLFERSSEGGAVFGKASGLTRACYSVDFSNASDTVAVSGGDGYVHVLNIHGQ